MQIQSQRKRVQNHKTQNLNEILQYIEDLLSKSQPQEAISICEQLLKEHPQSIEALFLKAIALQMDGRLDQALKTLLKEIASFQNIISR